MELPELKKRVSERKNSPDEIDSKFDIMEERSQSLNTQPQTLSKLKPTHTPNNINRASETCGTT